MTDMIRSKIIPEVYVQKDGRLIVVDPESVRQMGEMILQMGEMIGKMQHRLDQLEEKERMITLSHEEVKIVQQMIRNRSLEYCEKYQIVSPGNLRSITAGIKRSILQRYGVSDLHDVPAIARQAVEAQIARWSDIRLVMKCRERISSA